METAFIEIGLSEAKAKETAKNEKLANNLGSVISSAKKRGRSGDGLKEVGSLLYHVASKLKTQVFGHADMLVDYICSGKIDSEARLNAALDYVLKNPEPNPVNKADFERACGVGIIVTKEQIEQSVQSAIAAVKGEILSKRYRYPEGMLMGAVRKELPWADGKAVKSTIGVELFDLLGPKTDADLAPAPKPEKKKKEGKEPKKKDGAGAAKETKDGGGGGVTVNGVASARAENETTEEEDGASTIAELMRTKVRFHKPGDNFTTDGYVLMPRTKELIAAHLKRTGGQVRTRFPPEPNGLLHIGHAKAININFGYAAAHGGTCNLRYDDTNPEKEEEKFFTGIKDVVEWLGYKPARITHSSDNFGQLYEWAKFLIEKDLAYVCHQKVEDIRGFNPPPSPWRDRPVSESRQLFEDMKNGKFDEGQATLRLKTTLEEGKQDPVAYRIKYAAHHRTGDQWCIYPTYDYTHCLCDSIEDITHSLCTKEFQNRRSSYYWLCNSLEIYCPVQWEYGRLNVSYTVVSKRKIGKLISSGICKDWDDPRLFTLAALRRRGFPAEAINNFCARMGVTGAKMVVDPSMLEAVVRSHLNQSAPRSMVVLEPLKVNIVNLVKNVYYEISVPDFPDFPERGSHNIAFGPTVYIEKSDFKETIEKGYRRLAPGQAVGLKYADYVLKLIKVHKGCDGKVSEIDVECQSVTEAPKPKAFIHWVADPIEVEVRLYERLFRHKNPEDPAEVPGGFLEDINRDSLTVARAVADKSLGGVKVYDRFQFERNGFFTVDKESDEGRNKLVFNRTVSLKEDNKKV